MYDLLIKHKRDKDVVVVHLPSTTQGTYDIWAYLVTQDLQVDSIYYQSPTRWFPTRYKPSQWIYLQMKQHLIGVQARLSTNKNNYTEPDPLKLNPSELVIPLKNGNYLATDGEVFMAGAYVRVISSDNTELGYWDKQEWADDPELVMGAILRCAAGMSYNQTSPDGHTVSGV